MRKFLRHSQKTISPNGICILPSESGNRFVFLKVKILKINVMSMIITYIIYIKTVLWLFLVIKLNVFLRWSIFSQHTHKDISKNKVLSEQIITITFYQQELKIWICCLNYSLVKDQSKLDICSTWLST